MNTTTDLLSRLQSLNVRIYVFGDQLVVDAPAGVLTDVDRRAMTEHKAELLDILQEPPGEHLPGARFVPAHDAPGSCGICDEPTGTYTFICDDCAGPDPWWKTAPRPPTRWNR